MPATNTPLAAAGAHTTFPVLTITASRLLGAPVYKLTTLIYRQRIPAPRKDESGRYVWSEEDIARARTALRTDLRRKRNRLPTDDKGAA